MPVIMQNAAAMAYQKAIKKTRESLSDQPDTPEWLKHFGKQLVEDDSNSKPTAVFETPRHQKMRTLLSSSFFEIDVEGSETQIKRHPYLKISWFVYDKITSKLWFEVFILLNIVLIGVITGLDLEFDHQHTENNQYDDLEKDEKSSNVVDNIDQTSTLISYITLSVFILEIILKFIAEGFEPWRYFTDRHDGYFNSFDFIVVLASLVFIRDANGEVIGFLRMLRLLRLLSFVKGVPQLRIIVAGLTQGMKSVVYIIMLLFLIIYMYSILGCILFGENDPAHYGTVSIAVVTLFQVSTLASWTSIAYVSWFGCEDYQESPYGEDNPSRIQSMVGSFEGFKCTTNTSQPLLTGLFYSSYILLTSWVIMSLFVGVISMGMFQSYLEFKEQDEFTNYLNKLDENSLTEEEAEKLGKICLRVKIEKVLNDVKHDSAANASNHGGSSKSSHHDEMFERYKKYVTKSIKIRDSNYFNLLITLTILTVGVTIGFETDYSLSCHRMEQRLDDDETNALRQCQEEQTYSLVIGVLAQIIFTCEMMIKVFAEGVKPLRYFTDKENGSWNCLDCFVVVVGFLELSTLKSTFENFPIVLLRLLRLVRVARLAKALPRLRSIVEALVSGFSSVGWICVLILVFNYIVACLLMLVFGDNDPYHFSSVGSSMFTVLRIETLDSWDQVLYIAMYGCDGYPNGYEFLAESHQKGLSCEESKAYGWLGTFILLIITIIGAYILPTVLIGVVSIKFDSTNSYFISMEGQKKDFNRQLELAKRDMPEFFTEERVETIVDLFETLNVAGDIALDMPEISIFFHYSFDHLLGVELTREHCSSLFYLLDTSKQTKIGLGQFVAFIVIIKKMHNASMKHDQKLAFRVKSRNDHEKRRRSSMNGYQTTWAKAMDKVHQESYEMTWDSILMSINGEEGDTLKQRIINIFKEFDSDGSGQLDEIELGEGLKSCGIPLNHAQVKYFFRKVAVEGSRKICIDDFIYQVESEVQLRLQMKDENLLNEMRAVLARTSLKFGNEAEHVDFLSKHSAGFFDDEKENRKVIDMKKKIKILTQYRNQIDSILEQLHSTVSNLTFGDSVSDDENSDSDNSCLSISDEDNLVHHDDEECGSRGVQHLDHKYFKDFIQSVRASNSFTDKNNKKELKKKLRKENSSQKVNEDRTQYNKMTESEMRPMKSARLRPLSSPIRRSSSSLSSSSLRTATSLDNMTVSSSLIDTIKGDATSVNPTCHAPRAAQGPDSETSHQASLPSVHFLEPKTDHSIKTAPHGIGKLFLGVGEDSLRGIDLLADAPSEEEEELSEQPPHKLFGMF